MLEGSSAGEYWDVSATFTGGARFFARYWVTNEGPGTHTGVAMGSFVGADGSVANFQYARDRGSWLLGAGGRYVQIASAVLDLREPSGRIEIDTDKYGLKIYLRFNMERAPRPLCARRTSAGGFDVLRLAEEVEGILWVKGMTLPLAAKGSIDITHGWSSRSEIDEVHRRIDASGRDGDHSFFAASVAAPGNEGSRCVVVVRGGETIYESNTVKAEIDAAPLGGTEGNYPAPATVRFHDEQLALEVTLQRQLLRINPLDIVPQPFRTLLGLRSRPRRSWSESAWKLRLGAAAERAELDQRGAGSVAVTYTNPW